MHLRTLCGTRPNQYPLNFSFLVSCGAEVTTLFPRAGRRSVSLLAAPPAKPAASRFRAVRLHVSKNQAAVTSTNFRFLADSTGDPPPPRGNSGLLLLLLPPRWDRRPISPRRPWGRDGGLIKTHRLRRGKQSQVSLYFPLRISPRPGDISFWSHGYHQS